MLSFSSCTSKHCAVQTVFWKKRELIANAIKMELYFLCVCGNHNGLLAQMEKQIKDYFLFFYLSYIFLFPLIVKVHILGLQFFFRTSRTTTTEQKAKTNTIYSPLSQKLAEIKVSSRLVFSRDVEGEPVPRYFSASGGLSVIAAIPCILSIHLPHPSLLSPTWYSSCMHFSM